MQNALMVYTREGLMFKRILINSDTPFQHLSDTATAIHCIRDVPRQS